MSLRKCTIYQVEAHFGEKILSHFIFLHHKLHRNVLGRNLGSLGDRQALSACAQNLAQMFFFGLVWNAVSQLLLVRASLERYKIWTWDFLLPDAWLSSSRKQTASLKGSINIKSINKFWLCYTERLFCLICEHRVFNALEICMRWNTPWLLTSPETR